MTTTIDWKNAKPGDVVLDKEGTEWMVQEWLEDGRVVINSETRSWTGHVNGQVRLVGNAATMSQAAERVVQEHLPGSITISRQRPDGTHLCPVTFAAPDTALAHLRTFHGPDSRDYRLAQTMANVSDVMKQHEKAHNGPVYEPHVHDPDWKEVLE
jgi:hypothetical protein